MIRTILSFVVGLLSGLLGMTVGWFGLAMLVVALSAPDRDGGLAMGAFFDIGPIGGLVGFFLIPKVAHYHHLMVRLPLLILVGLHVVGALWHQIVVRDNLLARMWRPV